MISFKVENLNGMNEELSSFTEFLHSAGVHDDDIFASRLVSSELITNVIRHGGEPALFSGTLSRDGIRITVTADSLKGVDLSGRRPDPLAESGRGLYIVRSFISGDIEREGGVVSVFIKRSGN